MKDLLELFNKMVEYYGQTVAVIILIVIVIIYSIYLLLKNHSSLVKNYFEIIFNEKIANHTTATKRRKTIAPKIRTELLELAKEIKADRVLVFEFSNGTSNLVGLPFLYMSSTCEVTTPGTFPVSVQYQKVNTAIVSEFLEILEEKGYYYIKNLQDSKDDYPILYNFMNPNGVRSALFYTLYGVNDTIGFIVATTVKDHSFTREDALPRIAGTAQIISSLLNFDDLNDDL